MQKQSILKIFYIKFLKFIFITSFPYFTFHPAHIYSFQPIFFASQLLAMTLNKSDLSILFIIHPSPHSFYTSLSISIHLYSFLSISGIHILFHSSYLPSSTFFFYPLSNIQHPPFHLRQTGHVGYGGWRDGFITAVAPPQRPH